MLELKDIKKDYLTGENTVHALKGINLKFRSSEFVSILGQSGCGKTTMLNIIGGLDKYTSGDLIINGRSTKDYRNRDWDAYRNHSIGFVFQSYNLIPHQTVLQNVELALTISGVSKSERKERAKKALEDVGLGNQLSKRPSEMSGGQMQRVAIARALVNNPDIILADEPTGALDTETSVQVMEILKNISKDRLIIMVTHNPELAEKYSSRIIRMLDGEVKDDSRPLTEEECRAEQSRDKEKLENAKKEKKPSMSFGTAFLLSLKNLFTKKGRTILTAFAGSIGIIGISLILSISEGLTGYIDAVQEDTLSSYPLSIQNRSADLTSVMSAFMNIQNEDSDHELDAIYSKAAIYDIINAMSNIEINENDLKSFKAYIEKEKNNENGKLKEALNGVQYSYNLDLQIYTKNIDGNILRSDATQLMQDIMGEYMGVDLSSMNSSAYMMDSMNPMSTSLWQELLPGKNGEIINPLLENQYDVIYGDWPNDENEVVLVVDENNELDDITLYALGLVSKEEIDKIVNASLSISGVDAEVKKWTFEEICNTEYRVVLNSDCYLEDEITGLFTDLRDTEAGLQYLYDNGITLRVSGIIRPKEDATATMLNGAIGYTSRLTESVIEKTSNSDVVKAQLENERYDVTNGLPFEDKEGNVSAEYKKTELNEYIDTLDTNGKAMMYVNIKCVISDEDLAVMVEDAMKDVTVEEMRATVNQVLVTQMGMSEETVSSYTSGMDDASITEMYRMIVEEQVKAQYSANVVSQMSSMTSDQLAMALDSERNDYTDEEAALYYDNVMEFSSNTYDGNLNNMGYIDIDSPATINLYASSFANKDIIEEVIDDYNRNVDELQEIKYTDYVGLMMSSISTIIDAITYILIAFVAISLIVSSIMIGVITLISVQERTKEIGILRAIGASKKDVSSMFNAETVIIGFVAGLLGVVVTYILCIPINSVIHSLTEINSLNAFLPIPAAIILILISMLLTLIAGIIPSRSAAKKDPVVALRTE